MIEIFISLQMKIAQNYHNFSINQQIIQLKKNLHLVFQAELFDKFLEILKSNSVLRLLFVFLNVWRVNLFKRNCNQKNQNKNKMKITWRNDKKISFLVLFKSNLDPVWSRAEHSTGTPTQ